jgi:alanine dehydrogenase
VLIERGAGVGSGFSDEDYAQAGCKLLDTPAQVYAQSDMVVKVKEPLAPEYELIRENQIIFTYFHFASCPELTEAMVKSKAVCIAYETVARADKSLPLLTPMSEIAGRMSIQCGASYLQKPMGGRGVLLGGVPGVPKGNVLILGAGIVGTEAARMAAGMHLCTHASMLIQ